MKRVSRFFLVLLLLLLIPITGIFDKCLNSHDIIRNVSATGFFRNVKNPVVNELHTIEFQNDFQHAIIATADAYWRRSVNLQYEPRLKYYHNPEEAAEDNVQYGTCNTFTYNVYKEALGISTPLNARSATYFFNEKSDYAVVALDGDGYKKCIEAGLENTILPKLEPGDMIIYLNSQKRDGHVQMVYSLVYDNDTIVDAWLIHGTTAGNKKHATECRVSRYDSKQVEGSVQKIKFLEYYKKFQEFDPSKPRYLNYFVVVRPIINKKNWMTWDNYTLKEEEAAKIKKSNGKYVYGKDKYGIEIRRGSKKTSTIRTELIKITDAALDRMRYENIYISKSCSFHNNSVVPIDSELSYTVTIKNLSNKEYAGITVKEEIPLKADYITGGDFVENGSVIWKNIRIPAGETRNFIYSVKTPSTIGAVLLAKGKVNNINTTTVKNICGKIFNEEEVDKIRKNFYKLQNSSSNTGFLLINEVYADAFGKDLGLGGLTTTDILDNTNNMVALNSMATLMHNDNQFDYNRRIKYYSDYDETMKFYHTARIKENNLHPGEIILSSKDKDNYAYIYLGDSIVGKNSDGMVMYKTAEEKDIFLKGLYFADEVKDSTGSYIKQNEYKVKNIVLSPANIVK